MGKNPVTFRGGAGEASPSTRQRVGDQQLIAPEENKNGEIENKQPFALKSLLKEEPVEQRQMQKSPGNACVRNKLERGTLRGGEDRWR